MQMATERSIITRGSLADRSAPDGGSTAKRRPGTGPGPYSRVLRRGAIGVAISGRSQLGRLVRDMERQLSDHVGGNPSITQRLLIDRAIKIRLQLDALDKKLAEGAWTAHDGRTYGGLLNAFRLAMRELGLQPASPKTGGQLLDDHLARLAAEGEAV
jgi:hypothetical protein